MTVFNLVLDYNQSGTGVQGGFWEPPSFQADTRTDDRIAIL